MAFIYPRQNAGSWRELFTPPTFWCVLTLVSQICPSQEKFIRMSVSCYITLDQAWNSRKQISFLQLSSNFNFTFLSMAYSKEALLLLYLNLCRSCFCHSWQSSPRQPTGLSSRTRYRGPRRGDIRVWRSSLQLHLGNFTLEKSRNPRPRSIHPSQQQGCRCSVINMFPTSYKGRTNRLSPHWKGWTA